MLQKYRIYLEFPKKRFSFVVTKQYQEVFERYHKVVKLDQNEKKDSVKIHLAYPRFRGGFYGQCFSAKDYGRTGIHLC